MSDTTLCGGWLQSVGETDAVWCPVCEIWLNGQTQWEDHKIGKKHRKNVEKENRAATTSRVACAVQGGSVVEEPEKKTEMWEWLEAGRKDKLAVAVATRSTAAS